MAITHARVGMPGWRDLVVIDLDTGMVLRDVVEVNSEAGWLVRFARDAEGRLMSDVFEERSTKERVHGRFEIRRRDEL